MTTSVGMLPQRRKSFYDKGPQACATVSVVINLGCGQHLGFLSNLHPQNVRKTVGQGSMAETMAETQLVKSLKVKTDLILCAADKKYAQKARLKESQFSFLLGSPSLVTR